MEAKTSVTLPLDLLERINRANANRSAFVERAVRFYLERLEKARRDAADDAIINRHADRLNTEAADVLVYQRLP